MLGILTLGFFVGMSHALEADHLAAMATLARGGGRRTLTLRGTFWGAGHALTLLAMGIFVILFGVVLSDAGAARLEFAVGLMLALLGGHLLVKLVRGRIHFHVHRHGEEAPHFHAHSHVGEEGDHGASAHAHAHPPGLPWRALLVGLVHGAAGSAALLTLALATTQSPWVALTYIALFGLGAMVGMAALSYAVALPLRFAERSAKAAHSAVTLGAALIAVWIGAHVMVTTAGLAWGGI